MDRGQELNRVRNPISVESDCSETDDHLKIGNAVYMRSADGFLMPAKKGQPAPSLKYFGKPLRALRPRHRPAVCPIGSGCPSCGGRGRDFVASCNRKPMDKRRK